MFLATWEPLVQPETAWPWDMELGAVSEGDSVEAADRGLPVGRMGLECPARGSAWESVEGSVGWWVPAVEW